jgi:AraC-like DNA-binding protein
MRAEPPAAALRVISTHELAPRDRLPAWGEAVWRLIGGLQSDAFGDDDFDGCMTVGESAYVGVCKIDATRHRVVRTPSLARHAERGFLKVVAQLRGHALFEQFGRSVCLSPGEWSVYDTTHAYSVSNPDSVEQLVLMIPKDKLPERAPLDDVLVQRLSSQHGVARLTWQSMLTAYQELPNMSRTAAEGTADVLTQLVFLSLLDLRGTSSAVSQREVLRDRIKAHVGRHLGDPQLNVEAIARALNCSRRHLYNAFADESDGVAGYVLAQRLELVRRQLEDPRLAGHSITEVALDAGFNQPAHFSPTFRARFGLSPREWRQRHNVLLGGA